MHQTNFLSVTSVRCNRHAITILEGEKCASTQPSIYECVSLTLRKNSTGPYKGRGGGHPPTQQILAAHN